MSDPMATEQQQADEAGATSRWEDYVDIYISPAELYRRRAADRVGPPLLTLLGLALLFYFIMLPANRIMMMASVADNPDAVAMMERFGMLFQVIGSVFVPITYLVVLAVAAVVLVLVGRLADIRTDFSRAMLITTYAGFVYLLSQVAGGVAVMIHGDVGLDVVRHMSFGPLRFLGTADMDPVQAALLRRLEIFTLWQAALWGIGISVIYGVSRARGFTVAAIAWLLLTLPAVLMAALGWGGAATRGG